MSFKWFTKQSRKNNEHSIPCRACRLTSEEQAYITLHSLPARRIIETSVPALFLETFVFTLVTLQEVSVIQLAVQVSSPRVFTFNFCCFETLKKPLALFTKKCSRLSRPGKKYNCSFISLWRISNFQFNI